jgi:hypothetical protein
VSYSNNVPVPPQSLGNSRPLINGNYRLIDDVFQQDHVEFNDANGLGPGKHTAVHFPIGEVPSTNAGEIALFMKLVSTIPRLFMMEPSSGTQQQISGTFFTGQGSGTNSAEKVGGITPCFGGFYIAWGFLKVAPQTLVPITFAAECGANFPNNCFVVFPVANDPPIKSNPSVTVTSVTQNGCTFGTAAAPSLYFVAIGN